MIDLNVLSREFHLEGNGYSLQGFNRSAIFRCALSGNGLETQRSGKRLLLVVKKARTDNGLNFGSKWVMISH